MAARRCGCCLWWLLATLLVAVTRAGEAHGHPRKPNTTYISQVLNRLTERTKYDRRLRPLYGTDPVEVGITIHVSSISAVSEVDMDFTIDLYLRQTWRDPRLAFGTFDMGFAKIDSLTVGVDYLERLWKPDTFFPNEKKSFFHIATTHNSFLRIEPDGQVSTSERLTVTAMCSMNLQLFPMDLQACKLEIESYGYTTADIDYFWGKRKTDTQESAVAFSDFTLPQFKRSGYRVNITKAKTSSGEYVRLYFEIILKRNIGFYLMNIIIPSVLIVMISWVSFWINREATPARVGLGFTTILTITTVITTTNNSMPKVSYVKSLDVFLNFCFIMVFAALVEYAIVSYMGKKLKMRQEKKKKQQQQQQQQAQAAVPPEMPIFNTPALPYSDSMSFKYRPPGLPVVQTYNTSNQFMSGECDCRTAPLMHPHQMVPELHVPPFRVIYGKRRRTAYCLQAITPSKIDQCSRCMFPVVFVFFNLLFWTVMHILSNQSESQNYVSFDE